MASPCVLLMLGFPVFLMMVALFRGCISVLLEFSQLDAFFTSLFLHFKFKLVLCSLECRARNHRSLSRRIKSRVNSLLANLECLVRQQAATLTLLRNQVCLDSVCVLDFGALCETRTLSVPCYSGSQD